MTVPAIRLQGVSRQFKFFNLEGVSFEYLYLGSIPGNVLLAFSPDGK